MKKQSKKILYSTSVIIVVFFISVIIKTNYSSSFQFGNSLPSVGIEAVDNQDVSNHQEKEPVYMSVFKLIVNCNPFKQKKAVQ
ncbi:MAG: hypothetical protein ABI388_09120 [Bacteroidia bacterium]